MRRYIWGILYFEFLVTGRADYPEVIFSGDDFDLINVPFGEGSGRLFFSDENTLALIDGVVDGGITGGGAGVLRYTALDPWSSTALFTRARARYKRQSTRAKRKVKPTV